MQGRQTAPAFAAFSTSCTSAIAEDDEVELYPPNEPQFVEEQLSERMAKALLRV